MNPAPESPTDAPIDRSRQLILTQVQLMELEDARDDLATRLQDVETLLDRTRNLGDQILADHERLAETNRALQRELEAFRVQEQELRTLIAAADDRAASISRNLQAERETTTRLQHELRTAQALAAERLAQRERLQGVIADMQTTRSWRYTRLLRALESKLGRGGS